MKFLSPGIHKFYKYEQYIIWALISCPVRAVSGKVCKGGFSKLGTVVVVGGGWAGCAAAVASKKRGSNVLLLERTDMLLGTGLVGGIMGNNGRLTAAGEAVGLGFDEIFNLIGENYLHAHIEFPGHMHASLYNVATIEPGVKRLLAKLGVTIHFETRITDVDMEGSRINYVLSDEGSIFKGDVFIDTTGSAGGIANCGKYGHGCAMCILRCPSFGGRVSIAAKAGVLEIIGTKKDGTIGAMSGSCTLVKQSLASHLLNELENKGVLIIPIPPEHVNSALLEQKACQQYATREYAENIIILDTGHAKLMNSFYPLEQLRAIPGLENARFEDPYAAGRGNSVRFLGMAPRDDALKVQGVDNLFCAGEKAGLLVGHTEAIITGSLAGLNAARMAGGLEPVTFPDTLAIGDAISFVREEMNTEEGCREKYTFSGSILFERMKEKGLYTTDMEEIRKRVRDTGFLENL